MKSFHLRDTFMSFIEMKSLLKNKNSARKFIFATELSFTHNVNYITTLLLLFLFFFLHCFLKNIHCLIFNKIIFYNTA